LIKRSSHDPKIDMIVWAGCSYEAWNHVEYDHPKAMFRLIAEQFD